MKGYAMYAGMFYNILDEKSRYQSHDHESASAICGMARSQMKHAWHGVSVILSRSTLNIAQPTYTI